ncbi:MgtC/SapB family protein [Sphingobacterium thalpophilum]|uniref:MgtC/SapB family protein n=1 Tax=Sphingobacterium thalpophilum TaxID=259 RepID=A0ABV4HKN1_9SPHI
MESITNFLISEPLLNALTSILCGSLIGFEREYRNKSAGFRTVVLICFGSAMFTIVSCLFTGSSSDRVAANIVTGIGFIGAGVIFKGKLSVSGLTTAAVIWATAGIGMFAGLGKLQYAISFSLFMVLILALFQRIEMLLARYYLVRSLHIKFGSNEFYHLHEFEQMALDFKIRATRRVIEKVEGKLEVMYDISGKMVDLDRFNQQLAASAVIDEFYYNK